MINRFEETLSCRIIEKNNSILSTTKRLVTHDVL